MIPSRNLGLHHLAIRTPNIAAMRHFYVDLLGFAIEREVPEQELWLTAGTDSLVFLRGSAGPSPALDHFGIMVPHSNDVAKWESYLRQHGVTITEPTEVYDDASVGMICRDPAGHHLQVLWHPAAVANLTRPAS